MDDWNRRRVAERRRLPLVDLSQEFNDNRDALLAAPEHCPEDGAARGS